MGAGAIHHRSLVPREGSFRRHSTTQTGSCTFILGDQPVTAVTAQVVLPGEM